MNGFNPNGAQFQGGTGLAPDPSLPQPPPVAVQQQHAAPPPSPTLGQANGDPSGLPPGNPVLDQYTQAIGATLDMMKQRGFIRDPVPPQPGPGILESLGTFGMANLKHIADENTRREENYKILQQNRVIGLKGAEMATKMVDTQAMGGLANTRIQIALQNNQIALARFLADQQERQVHDARNKVADHIKFDLRPAPKSSDDARMMRLQGWGESADNPGFWEKQRGGDGGGGGGGTGGVRLTKQPDGSWGTKAGSPANTALTNVGGGGVAGGAAAGGAADPNAPLPGEAPEDTADRIKNQNKMKLPTAATRAMIEQAPGVADLSKRVRGLLQDLQLNPLSARGREFAAGTLGIGDAPFTKYRTAAKLLTSKLMRMHVGARGSEGMMAYFKNLLDTGIQSPENMGAALDEIDQYTGDLMKQGGAVGNPTTTDTATSGGPPSSLGGTKSTAPTGVTPNGIRFRVVQ